MSLRNSYERALGPLSLHGPDYGMFRRANDGKAHGIWRIAFHASWGLLAAGLVVGFAVIARSTLAARPLVAVLLAVGMLFGVKWLHVIDRTYRPDPLDWLCDVGAWATAGALVAAHFLLALPWPPLWLWLVLLAVYLLTYPWATP